MSVLQGGVGCICDGRHTRKGLWRVLDGSLRWRDLERANSRLIKTEGGFKITRTVIGYRGLFPGWGFFAIVLAAAAVGWAGSAPIKTANDWLRSYWIYNHQYYGYSKSKRTWKHSHQPSTPFPPLHDLIHIFLPTSIIHPPLTNIPILNLVSLNFRIREAGPDIVQKRPRLGARFRVLDKETPRQWELDLGMRTWDDFKIYAKGRTTISEVSAD